MKCKKGDELHPLAAILLSCPLVWVFLNPEGTFELSSTHQEKLRDTVRDTLNRWYGILPNKTAWTTTLADFEKWIFRLIKIGIQNFLANIFIF